MTTYPSPILQNVTVNGALAVSGAVALSASGTALAVTNNATVGGTLGVTGAATITGALNVPGNIINLGAGGTSTVDLTQLGTGNVRLNLGGSSSFFNFRNSAGASMLQVGGATNSIAYQAGMQESHTGSWAWSGTQFVNGGAIIYSNTNQSGSSSSGNPVAYHYLNIASDTVQYSGGGVGVANVWAGLTTGASITGSRKTVYGALTIGGTPGDTSQYSAGQFQAQATAAANAGGNILYGLSASVGGTAAATGAWSFENEIDLAAPTGTTPVYNTGLQIVLLANHAVRGSAGLDSGFVFGNTSGTTGWKYGIRFGGPGNPPPFASDSTLIWAHPTAVTFAVTDIVDFSNVTASGHFLRGPSDSFTVDGSGNTTALTYKVNTNQVVGARVTGWGAATGGSRAAFTAGTATLAQTAAAVAQLIADLTTHGLIGA